MFITLVPVLAVAFWVAASIMSKNNKTKFSSMRIPVKARVVYYERNRGRNMPPKVTFDYLLPDGRTHRLTKYAPLNPVDNKPLFSFIQVDDIFTVYVDPLNPTDVHLGAKFDIARYKVIALYGLAIVFTGNALFLVVGAFAR